jgi:hypothetical protein
MITHIYSHFLTQMHEYAAVEKYWINLWEQIEPNTRQGWQQPWFQPLPPSISEGNPIFTAVSLVNRRAIRIIQFEPTENTLEFVAYPDTFGGSSFDPKVIHELVISCALSDMAAMLALSLMRSWVEGNGLSADFSEAGLILSGGVIAEKLYDTRLLHGITSHANAGLVASVTYEHLWYVPAA